MEDQNKSGLSDALEKGASAASTIQGAIKTGKAVAAAAKGAAAGGPYGAVAGALWANRKTVVKVILAAAFLLLLPILFILMLPGLIFGGLTEGGSPNDPNIPILNNNVAIVENANNISFSVNSILAEGLEDVTARIEADFAASGADGMEITNPYADNLMSNINLFVSQYCAAKDKDFAGIALSDMEATLRSGKKHLYSFSKTEETRTSTTTDPETGEETTTTELWIEGCTASEPQRILDALAEGKLVVAIMTKGHFTTSGHFIVLRGVQDGNILVADPASYKRSQQAWDLSIILNEASKRAAAGGAILDYWMMLHQRAKEGD